MRNRISILLALFLLCVTGSISAQTLKSLTHQPPDGATIGFLLTDGTVLFQGNQMTDWWKLAPDNKGSYLNGTWSQVASLPSSWNYIPLYFASAVLADGRVVIDGGEYNNLNFTLTNQGGVYDPVADTWTKLNPPTGWKTIGDSPSVVLPDGRFVVGQKLTKNLAALDPKTMKWTALSSKGKADFDAEEGWTLLPDGSFLTYDVKNAPHSERYFPSKNEWVSAGSTIVDLHSPHQGGGCIPYPGGCYYPPGEVGPGLLLPNGTVLANGSASNGGSGVGHTAIYNVATGKWTKGPDFPNGDNAGDSYGAVLPNGKALVLGASGTLYEFDGKQLTTGPLVFYNSSLIVLPSGEVIVAGSQLYSSKGTYQSSWAPKITKSPSSVTRGSTYPISGQQFNGLTQAASYGDENETATNYPLVRITNSATGHVYYARTHDHSTMGVATGKAIVSTNFDVPAKMETGAAKLVVVANGVPSKAVSITVN